MDTLTLIIALLIVLVLVGMVAAFMMSNEASKKARALAVIKGQAPPDENSGKNDREAQDKRRAEIAQKLKDSNETEGKKGKTVSTKAKLKQAGMSVSVKQFYIFSLIFSCVFTFVLMFAGAPKIALPLIWFFGFMGMPKIFVGRKIKKRQKKFLLDFGDALEAMVRLLKAGMPVTEAIAMAGREYEGPVGDEMLMIYDAQKVGVSLPDATMEAAVRMPLMEMQMFATGIAIQTQTGASLSEVLTNLAGVIKARFRLRKKVQALSSEAKASAMIIGCLPFLVGGGMFLINPDYINILFETMTGNIMIAGGAFWMFCGVMVMKVMINFKI